MRLLVLLISLALPAAAQEFSTLKGHGGPIMGIAVSDAGQVATASFDNSVGLWSDGLPTWLEGHEAAVSTLNYALAPVLLTGGDDFRVLLWNTALETAHELTKHLGKVSDIAISQDGTRLASASWDGTIHLMQPSHDTKATTLPVVLHGHRSGVNAVAFHSSGALFSGSSDGTLRIWEGQPDSMSSRAIVHHGFGINKLIVSDDWLAYGAVDGGTRVIHPVTGDLIADFTLDRRPILSLAHHRETGQIAVGDGQGYIMMIDSKTWRIARDFRATRRGPVWALAFSNDGQTIWAGGLDDIVYGWPVALLDEFDPAMGQDRSFLQKADTMPNGERQFMRKCSICHSLDDGPSRKAGPTLHGVFGRAAGTVPAYRYSQTLHGSDIVWTEDSIDALFDVGPDHYIPGSKMPMQVIAKPQDRADLIAFLKQNTTQGD